MVKINRIYPHNVSISYKEGVWYISDDVFGIYTTSKHQSKMMSAYMTALEDVVLRCELDMVYKEQRQAVKDYLLYTVLEEERIDDDQLEFDF